MPVIGKVTIPAGQAVSVLSALVGTLTGSYTVMIYAPQSESLSLALADAAGVPADPMATFPAQSNPFIIKSTSADVFVANLGSSSVVVTVMAWARQPVVLNANSDFETGITPWVNGGNSTLSRSAVWAKQGSYSLLITPDGVTGNPGALSEVIPYAGGQVQVTAWCYSPQGWASAGAQIGFNYFIAGSYVGGYYPAGIPLAAGVPTLYEATDTPSVTVPGTTGFQAFVQWNGTPPATTLLYVDQVLVS